MEEKKVTIGEKTLDLPSPFVVFATQNPIEHEGTYPLPEAQLDRFLMKIILTYPSLENEKKIFMQETGFLQKDTPEKPLDLKIEDIVEMIDYIGREVRVDEKIYEYVSAIIDATRKLTIDTNNQGYAVLSYGASTRAGLALIRTSRVRAILE